MSVAKPQLNEIGFFDPATSDLSLSFLANNNGSTILQIILTIYQMKDQTSATPQGTVCTYTTTSYSSTQSSDGNYYCTFVFPRTNAAFQNLKITTTTDTFLYGASIKLLCREETVDNTSTSSSSVDVLSDASDIMTFQCYSTPTFQFSQDSIYYGKKVTSSFVNLYVEYTQNAGLPLNSYEIRYATKQSYLTTTGKYNSSGTLSGASRVAPYLVEGLEDGKYYWFQIFGNAGYDGRTFEIESLPVEILVETSTSDNLMAIKLTTNMCQGYVELETNLNTNLYTLANGDGSNVAYQNSTTTLDLTNNAITYENSVGLSDDVQIALKIINPNANSVISELYDVNDNLLATLTYKEYTFESYNYTLDSDKMPIISSNATITTETHGHFELDSFGVLCATDDTVINGDTTWNILITINSDNYYMVEAIKL